MELVFRIFGIDAGIISISFIHLSEEQQFVLSVDYPDWKR